MTRFKHTAHRVSLTAMFISMSLVFMYLSTIVPYMRLTFYFISSVFIMGLLLEDEVMLSFMMYAAVSGLSMLLMPITMVLPYIIFFGHFGIGKYFIEKRVKDKIVRYVLKLLYFNIALVLAYLLVSDLFLSAVETTGFSIWIIVAISEAAFILYDFLFSRATAFYFNNIRRYLIKN